VFDIKRVDAITRVAVAEGAVMLDPDTAAVRLAAGQAAVVNGGVIARQAAGAVGAWRAGRLTFDDATLAEVASDLSRTLGRPVAVDPGLTRQRRTVTLNVAAVRDDPRLLGRLLDVRVQADARRWTLEPLR
jgi:transmembrane sensor